MESRTAALEDVLYQKGASFSAHLDDTNSIDNNEVPSDPSAAAPSSGKHQQRQSNNIEPHVAPSREYFDSLASFTGAVPVVSSSRSAPSTSGTSNEMYYSKDMSIFDDVNNNRLNLPLINDRFTVRQAPQLPQDDQDTITEAEEPSTTTASTAYPGKRSPRTGGRYNASEVASGLNGISSSVTAPSV